MKKNLLTYVIILIGNLVIARSQGSNNQKVVAGYPDVDNSNILYQGQDSLYRGAMVIDPYDTVVFDLSQAVVTGSYVEFPVYILSDDVVNAFDFSLKYNMVNFIYDSIIDIATYLNSTSYYNPNDSTIRFTSYSLLTYQNNTPLVKMRFTILSGQLCSSDLFIKNKLLNGDPCSFKIIDCIPAGIQENNNDNLFKIYPNPASEIINVETSEKVTVQLMDINSRQVFKQINVNPDQKQEINIQNIANGIYVIKIYNDTFSSMKKVVINK